MKEGIFSKKIRYLYEQLDISDNEFVNLFKREEDNKNTRKKVVFGWIKKEITLPKAFYFDEYPISTFVVDNEKSFTRKSFLEESYDDFKERVDRYVKNERYNKSEFEFDYRYIYYFDISSKEITYITIHVLEKIHEKKYKIKITPSEFYQDVQPYYGTLIILRDKYYLSLENDFEILSFYFVFNKGYTTNRIIYGLRLGLSYDKELPISAKNALAKDKLSPSQIDELYLNANESEYLIADESHLDTHKDIKTNYVNKLQQKIQNLTLFTKESKKRFQKTIFNDIYLKIFYQSLMSINKIAERVSHDKTYFISSRERATQIFLEGIASTDNTHCNIVYPLFNRDSSMFDEKSNIEAKEDIELNIQLAKNGLTINRIIVVTREYKVTKSFNRTIQDMIKNGINIRIAIKEEIEDLTGSYDFIYNKEVGVAAYRNIQERKCYFKVSKDLDKIKNLSNYFERIKEKSYTLEEFLAKPYNQNNKILNSLQGNWYWYFYGSMKEDNKIKIWNILVTIKVNGEVKCLDRRNNVLLLKGILDSTFNENQSFIKSTANKSKNLSLILLDNREIHKQVFRVSMMDKQHGRQGNMATFGIFSRVELQEDDIQDALGSNVDETRLLDNQQLEDKVNQLDINVKSKNLKRGVRGVVSQMFSRSHPS